MICKKVLKRIALYISDDLDPSENKQVDEHIGACLSCYREYQAYLKSLRELKTLKEKPDLSCVMTGFTSEVMDRIAQDKGGKAAPVPRVSYRISMPGSLAAAAMVIIALGALYFVFFSNSLGTNSLTEKNNYSDHKGLNASEGSGNGQANPDGRRIYSPYSNDVAQPSEHKLKLIDPEKEKELKPRPHRLPDVRPAEFDGSRDF